jgi:RNA polymerase sigma-70 factor, ECF subfamily
MTSGGMEISAFQGGSSANISRPTLDRKGDEPDGGARERALVERAQDGDRDAFGDLYRMHLPAVARLVRFRLGREDEDAVSEVFLRAWRGLSSYRDTGVPFVGWLYGIARHVAIDALRRQGRDEPRDELPDGAVEPMTAEVLTLRGAIDALPTEQRQVIELKYLVGMSNDEVAAAMATTPGAVNARQWRALKALAEILEERS